MNNTEFVTEQNKDVYLFSTEVENLMINERLLMDDVLTSLHIVKYECEARDTKLGPEEITRDIPNLSEEALKELDENGIIRIGAEVKSSDILVGKLTPKSETDLTAEVRMLRAIFGEKSKEVRDTSLKVPHGETGIVIDVREFTRENSSELPPGVNKIVRVYNHHHHTTAHKNRKPIWNISNA